MLCFHLNHFLSKLNGNIKNIFHSYLGLGYVQGRIPTSGSDLNNFITPGIYTSTSGTAEISNLPPGSDKAGKLIVSDIMGTSNDAATSSYRYLRQVWQNYNTYQYLYIRVGHTGYGTTVNWQTWKTITAT